MSWRFLAKVAVVLAAMVGAAIVAAVILSQCRKRCPACGERLRTVNWFLCYPPPNFAFYACDHCGGEFVQVDRYDGGENPMIPRVGSTWADHDGWERSGRGG
jgi:hypothetical protein